LLIQSNMGVTREGVVKVGDGPVAELKVLRCLFYRLHTHFNWRQTAFKLEEMKLVFMSCAHVKCFLGLLIQSTEHKFEVAANAD